MPVYQQDGTLTDGPVAPTDQSTDPLSELVFETRVLHETLRIWMANDAPSRMLAADGRELILDPLTGNLPVVAAPAAVQRTVTPTVDTSAYASGDTLATALMRLDNVAVRPGGVTTLQSMVVTDGAVQSAALEVWFFDTPVITIPAANAAWSITDANNLRCVGVVATGPYFASALNSVSYRTLIGATMRTFSGVTPPMSGQGVLPNASASADLWAAVVVRGTPTYAVTDLQFTFTFYPDA